MKNNVRTKLLSLIFVCCCLLLLVIAFLVNYFWTVQGNIVKDLITNICISVASILGLSAAWEIVCKRSFAREVLELSNVSNNYIDSGIVHVYKSFKNIEWEKELDGVKNFTVFLCYGYTWRRQNEKILEYFAGKNNFIVVLPNYMDAKLVDELDRRFSYGIYSSKSNEHQSVMIKIEDAAKAFSKMGAEVKLHTGTLCSSYYFMDEKCIFVPYRNCIEQIDVPAIKSNSDGSFFAFCTNDMKRILENAQDWKEKNEK